MNAASLVREGRRRRGLSQRRLAEAAGVSQATVARIESGVSAPTADLVDRLVRSCGLELDVRLTEPDDADWSLAQANLRLDTDARVRQHQAALRFAVAGRDALARARTRA